MKSKASTNGNLSLPDNVFSEESPHSRSMPYFAINWKIREDSPDVNQFFVKKLVRTDQSAKPTDGKTLVVTNIPAFVSKLNLKSVFETFGEVDRVDVQQRVNSQLGEIKDYLLYDKQGVRESNVAYVVFKDVKSVEEIIELGSTDIKPIVLKGVGPTGIHSWMNSYCSRIKNVKILEAKTKEFMKKYEERELKLKAESGLSEPDADGWTNVTRKGKRSRAGAIRTEKMETKLLRKKARWEKRLVNFTPTQIKESRAKQLEELKKKFDEDKQRISLLKQQRKFKPF